MSDSEEPGIGIVGAGAWGRNLIRNFAATGQLRAVADLEPAARERVLRSHPGLRAVGTLDELLEDEEITAIVVATTSSAHFGLARTALRARRHVMVEKPLAQAAAEAAELVALADEARLTLMVGHLLEYHPAVDKLRELVGAGELGDVFYIYSQRVNLGKIRQDENALWSFGPHDVSVILNLLGTEPCQVSATGRAYLQPGLEDVVFVTLLFPGGELANIQLSWLDPHKIRRITLVGSKKMVVFDDMESTEKVRIYDKGVHASAAGQIVDYKDALTLRFGDIQIPHIVMREPLAIEAAEFIEAIRTGRAPRSDGRDGLRVVRVLEAAQRSMEAGGRPVALGEGVDVGTPAS